MGGFGCVGRFMEISHLCAADSVQRMRGCLGKDQRVMALFGLFTRVIHRRILATVP
jgi:hypothetical protein